MSKEIDYKCDICGNKVVEWSKHTLTFDVFVRTQYRDPLEKIPNWLRDERFVHKHFVVCENCSDIKNTQVYDNHSMSLEGDWKSMLSKLWSWIVKHP
jgi:hypothetical protein